MKADNKKEPDKRKKNNRCQKTTAAVSEETPVLGVCGLSGAGKTTLIERVLPKLKDLGLQVLVAKHGVHTIESDPRGKDSARLFDAGADVILTGKGQQLWRQHRKDRFALLDELRALSKDYDIILVEGHKSLPISKVWLLGPDENRPPVECKKVIAVLKRRPERTINFLNIIRDILAI